MQYGKKADPFYLSSSWRLLRKDILQRDHYVCQRCGRTGANIVHHIRPVKDHPELKRDPANLETVCERCHNALHPERNRKGAPPEEAHAPTGVRVIDLGGMF